MSCRKHDRKSAFDELYPLNESARIITASETEGVVAFNNDTCAFYSRSTRVPITVVSVSPRRPGIGATVGELITIPIRMKELASPTVGWLETIAGTFIRPECCAECGHEKLDSAGVPGARMIRSVDRATAEAMFDRYSMADIGRPWMVTPDSDFRMLCCAAATAEAVIRHESTPGTLSIVRHHIRTTPTVDIVRCEDSTHSCPYLDTESFEIIDSTASGRKHLIVYRAQDAVPVGVVQECTPTGAKVRKQYTVNITSIGTRWAVAE
jgi:hypothetical protein